MSHFNLQKLLLRHIIFPVFPQSPKQNIGLSHMCCEFPSVNLELHNTLLGSPVRFLYSHLFPTFFFVSFLRTLSFHDFYSESQKTFVKQFLKMVPPLCSFKDNKFNHIYVLCNLTMKPVLNVTWQVGSAAQVFSFSLTLLGTHRKQMVSCEMLETSHRGVCQALELLIATNRES